MRNWFAGTMRNWFAGTLFWTALVILLSLWLDGGAQAPKPRLSCEEITGGLYIANAQLAEQLRDTAAKLAEAQAELAKVKTPEGK